MTAPDTFRRPIRKAVMPVAGLGTRFLPATKAIPKEMLTVLDRPLIEHAVAEALEAGIEQIVFVTGRGKAAIEDHFDIAFELEATLAARGKSAAALGGTRSAPGSFVFVRQQEPLGLGHAVWCARHVIGDEPFAVLLPDELTVGAPRLLAQLMAAYHRIGGNLVGAIEVAADEVSRYGVIAPGASRDGLVEVRDMVEKPAADAAPSQLMIPGRYLLQPEIFAELAAHERGAGGEIQLTDAMRRLVGRQPFHALPYAGERHDCGDRAGFVRANLALALADPELGPGMAAFARERLATLA